MLNPYCVESELPQFNQNLSVDISGVEMKNELKHMSRAELLELLIKQIEENEKLASELEESKQKLEQKNIIMNDAGSIADAALKLNGIFEAADIAARQYVESIKQMTDSGSKEIMEFVNDFNVNYNKTKTDSEYIKEIPESPVISVSARNSEEFDDAKKEAEKIIAQARVEAEKIKREADLYWKKAKERARVLLNVEGKENAQK